MTTPSIKTHPKTRKLTPQEAHYAHQQAREGKSLASIAKQLGVGNSVVYQIVHGQTYQEVALEYPPYVPPKKYRRRLTDEQAIAVHKMAVQGKTNKEIAEELDITVTQAKNVLLGYTHSNIWCQFN